jgi:hypothetical protein
MDDKVNDGEHEIDTGMPQLVFLVPEREKRDGTFNDPEKQETADEDGHPFQWSLFEGLEIFNNADQNIVICSSKGTKEKRKKKGRTVNHFQ